MLTRAKITASLIFLCGVLLLVSLYLFHPRAYTPSAAKTAPCSSLEQERFGVQKDLFFTNGQQRLHTMIKSPRSTLVLNQSGGFNLVEHLEEIEAVMQEDAHKIRHLKANEGTYLYADHTFYANSVYLALYDSADGTTIKPEEAYLKGLAQRVSLTIGEGNFDFQAEAFKAHIRPPEPVR